jgi:hypothetical protein
MHRRQERAMDLYLKTVLVFVHFALAAFCLVTVISTDLKVLRHYDVPLTEALCAEIARVKRVVPHALFGLWMTGLSMVAYGMATSPGYLANDKLWFKFVVVGALTLNGVLVHRAGRVVRPGLVLATLQGRTALLLNVAGAASSVSWVWACFLGTARAWNGTLSFTTILTYYLVSLAAALAVAIGMHGRLRRRTLVPDCSSTVALGAFQPGEHKNV